MQGLGEEGAALESLREELLRACTSLRQALQVQREGVLLRASASLSDLAVEIECPLWFLREGAAVLRWQGRSLVLLEEGDGLDLLLGADSSWCMQHDFAIKLDLYDARQLCKSEQAGLRYQEYNSIRSRYLLALFALQLKGEPSTTPSVQYFEAGQDIITQGSSGKEVYTLVQGEAQVLVDDVEVGKVLPEEIFGALAALTGIARTAAVRASTRCMVMSLEENAFIELMRARPATLKKLVHDMARTIVSLNEQVLALQKKTT
jgi:CRP/FNR family cyclic AMP-dependent transcriptional regulator